MNKRANQMNELFHRAISDFILMEVELPNNAMATITKVITSNDLKNLKVFVSIFPEERRGSGLEVLNKSSHTLKEYLAKKLNLRSIPIINFCIDASKNKVEEVDRLLREIEREK